MKYLSSVVYRKAYLTAGWNEHPILVASNAATPLLDIEVMEQVEGHGGWSPDAPTRFPRFTPSGRVAA